MTKFNLIELKAHFTFYTVLLSQMIITISLLDMTEFRQDAEAVILNRKIYVVGGRDYKGERELYSSAGCSNHKSSYKLAQKV